MRTCLSKSRPFSAGSDLTRCCSAAVKKPLSRTNRMSSIECAADVLGPATHEFLLEPRDAVADGGLDFTCVLMLAPNAPGDPADSFAFGCSGGDLAETQRTFHVI